VMITLTCTGLMAHIAMARKTIIITWQLWDFSRT
jgi:hypothetical protein